MIANTNPTSVLDIGSGFGEFVNLFSCTRPNVPITSVDIKDYSLWFDRTGRVERIYKSIFELGPEEARDVVTCFEVIEHLPPERVEEAVGILRLLAKRRLFVSVPFMEPLPLYKGHYTRFEEANLSKLFAGARFTILGKGGKSDKKVSAWIMCEIDREVA
jgi:SAM-dependent methyltransferase